MDEPYRRASAECICTPCGREYWRHVAVKCGDSFDGQEMILHRICSGDLVKL